jgi:hypothetical protein
MRQACLDVGVKVRRIGPLTPTMHGGAVAADEWLQHPTKGVVAYTDLIAIGFIRTVVQAGGRVPEDVGVVGFDNITCSPLIELRLTTIGRSLHEPRLGSGPASGEKPPPSCRAHGASQASGPTRDSRHDSSERAGILGAGRSVATTFRLASPRE